MEHHRSGRIPVGNAGIDENSALAAEVFDIFCSATTLKSILGLHRHLCDLLKLRPTNVPHFYPKLKAKLKSWKAQALWKRLDVRASHKCYARGRACASTRVLVIGAGPCGLRAAIEAQLLGAKVVVIEKRDRISRNNVLHLWPFVIQDLRALGAKKFFGKFCAGAIDHISIRQLQCILLKVALLLGVEFHEGASFEGLIPPTDTDEAEKHGWRAEIEPADHPVSHYEFDVLIGADGKRNTLEGFKRKEFRGKLAIAITANFINKHSEAEARVEEISGVAFIFNQKFFKDLYQETGIDLENIVYYKDDTHYFVMTAKKHSLIDKGVILQDLQDTAKLLAPENVDRDALMQYAREAAEFSTNYIMTNLEFAVNHYGRPDVAMFDFTSMYAAENATRIIERNGSRLLMCLVGDSLLEPFWPTGSGCARGFLSCLDACWAIRGWGSGTSTPLEVLAERESIYRLLGQTTPENLQRDYASYTLCPTTRYPNLNRFSVTPTQVRYLYDTDNVERMEVPTVSPQDLNATTEVHKKRRRKDTPIHPDTLLHWIHKQLSSYASLKLENITESFKNGLALCAIIHRYRPELIDWHSLQPENVAENNQLAFDLLEKEMGIPPMMTGTEIAGCTTPDKLTMLTYLSQIYEMFHGEIPQTIKQPKIDMRELKKQEYPQTKLKISSMSDWKQKVALTTASTQPRVSGKYAARSSHAIASAERRRKRRSADKIAGREQRYQDNRRGSADDNFSGRIKNIEHKLKHQSGHQLDKKPPDLLRAIGKIESSDWNVREIEKKIMENKLGKNKTSHDKEKVPKWSREQFIARQSKMERKATLERTDSLKEKYVEIDKSLKTLDQKLKEGTLLEKGTRGNNKVAVMAEQFNTMPAEPEVKPTPLQKTASRSAIVLPTQGGSEMCHFCGTRVYLMERLSAEGRFFHRGCFRCQYCSITLRLGFYSFDAQNGQKFYCPQHAGMQGKTRMAEKSKSVTDKSNDSPDSKIPPPKDQTPERVEFSNLAARDQILSESEDPLSQMDEDEWTDRNFGQSAAEAESSDISDSDSDDLYEEALERAMPPDVGASYNFFPTRQLDGKLLNGESPTSDNCESSSDEFSSYGYSSDDDTNESATDDQENIRAARELRLEEVRVQAPLVPADTDTTGSDTEVVSDEESKSSEDTQDSATEISTDSEFKLDGTTPTIEIPPIMLNDAFITKTRGNFQRPKKVQIKSRIIEKNGNTTKKPAPADIQLNITPIVPDIATFAPKPMPNSHLRFYFLNRPHSTEGIASKVSLELKKQYLLGNTHLHNHIQKSGSASTLDTKLKSFHSNISEHQKLLNPSPSISPTMQAFLIGTSKLHTPLSPTVLKEDAQSESLMAKNAPSHKSDSDNEVYSPKIVRSTESPTAGISTQSIVKTVEEKISTQTDETTVQIVKKSNEDSEVRSRSPAQDTTIAVPEMPWTTRESNANNYSDGDDVETDSLSSFDENHSFEKQYHELSHSSSTANLITVPKLKINDGDDVEDMAMDSLLIIDDVKNVVNTEIIENTETRPNQVDVWASPTINSTSESRRSSSKNEPKFLNQPKQLDVSPVKLRDLHLTEMKARKSSSDVSLSSSDSNRDVTATALTETELSDWARDGTVSDDLADVEFKFDPDFDKSRKTKKPKFTHKLNTAINPQFVTLGDLDDVGHVCGKESKNRSPYHSQPMVLSHIADLDSIEFMDTASEESGFDNHTSAINFAMLKNQGYVQFVNVSPHNLKDGIFASDSSQMKSSSSSNSAHKDVHKSNGSSRNENDSKDDSRHNVSSLSAINSPHITKSASANQLKPKSEPKGVAMPCSAVAPSAANNAKECEKKTECPDAANPQIDPAAGSPSKRTEVNNANESFDSRKSRNKTKSGSPFKENINQENVSRVSTPVNTKVANTTLTTSEKLKAITKERTKQKNLIHEMVMDKLKTEKKLHSGKKSKVASDKHEITAHDQRSTGKRDGITTPKTEPAEIDVKNTNIPLYATPKKSSLFQPKTLDFSSASIPMQSQELPKYVSPVVKKTPERSEGAHRGDRHHRHSVVFDRELYKQEALFKRSSSINENLMFTIKNTPSCEQISSLSSEMYHSNKKPNRTKSFSEISRGARLGIQKSFSGIAITEIMRRNKDRDAYCKSEPCLVEHPKKHFEKKNGEKRRSIIQAVTDFFHKRKDSDAPRSSQSNSSPGDSSSKDKFSLFRLSPKYREKTKDKPHRRESSLSTVSKESKRSNTPSAEIVPPIPPPPLEYVMNVRRTTDDSFSETDLRVGARTCSTDTLDHSEAGTTLDRDQRRHIRRSQHKRLRIAQEIQRKLEETEVKTRELESRGVALEKILRGEEAHAVVNGQEETGLLAEWLTLMRELAALRRYERELLARAEDLRLEERHSLLAVQLRSSTGSQNTSPNEPPPEEVIIEQMLNIVEKRESLATLLEKNQQRYVKEDQDLEALMLAKGLQLTSIEKTPTK